MLPKDSTEIRSSELMVEGFHVIPTRRLSLFRLDFPQHVRHGVLKQKIRVSFGSPNLPDAARRR